MSALTIGSLFSGSGMLDRAVEQTLGAQTIWRSDTKPAAVKLIEHYWPSTNLGDITAIDWSQVQPVDVITGGPPCQDMSLAGRRRGMGVGTRSRLWSYMRQAIESIRPRLVVWENVRGALSACAESSSDSDLGYCPRCLDEGSGAGHAPNLRAVGRVVGDLAQLGYVGGWVGLSVADIGGAHRRFRIFVVAAPAADADHVQQSRQRQEGQWRTPPAGGSEVPERVVLLPTPRTSDTNGAGVHGAGGLDLRTVLALLPTPRAADGPKGAVTASESTSRRVAAGQANLAEPVVTKLLPTPGAGVQDWKEYEPAIRRQEQAFGRPAPGPTEIGPKGGRRLAPGFSEWLMGWPEGWTNVPGLSRSDRLSLSGDGVVPAQAAEALRRLLPHIGRAAA